MQNLLSFLLDSRNFEFRIIADSYSVNVFGQFQNIFGRVFLAEVCVSERIYQTIIIQQAYILDSRELITRLELLCPDAHKFPVAS